MLVEFLNENSLVEAWMNNHLRGENTRKNPGTWTDITASYAADLTAKYNAWLKEKHPPEVLRQWREAAGLDPDAAIPRLTPDQFGKASSDRFHAEAEFYLARGTGLLPGDGQVPSGGLGREVLAGRQQ